MLVVCSFSESHFLDGPDSRMGLKKRKNAGEGKKKKRRKKKKKYLEARLHCAEFCRLRATVWNLNQNESGCYRCIIVDLEKRWKLSVRLQRPVLVQPKTGLGNVSQMQIIENTLLMIARAALVCIRVESYFGTAFVSFAASFCSQVKIWQKDSTAR